MTNSKKGLDILADPSRNKSTAFTQQERDELGLRGLLPYTLSNQEMQVKRVMRNFYHRDPGVEQYMFMSSLHDRNERLFFRTVIENIDELMPVIYTPTVGMACKEFSDIFSKSKGFYITPDDKGHIRKMLDNWPKEDIRVIVVTDGERILGLGDLGANGMGIPVGKLALYTACAGVDPAQCLPVMLDVGCNREEILDNPLYLGYPKPRLKGNAYFELVEEFVMAIQDKYPKAMIQFEDFLTPNAYALLNKYRDRVCCFNDDIQGTAAVALAGVYASGRISGRSFKDEKIMFLGAGSAATGIADLMINAFMDEGLTEDEARMRLWFVDVKGLLVNSRTDLMPHNMPYAHDHEQMSFVESIDEIRPTVLIGATGAPNTFTQEVIEHMCNISERPVIFALSNPTSKSECTAENAYNWSQGKAIFASGSPFGPVEVGGQVFRSSQANNAYIFPGIGLGVINCEAEFVPEKLFLVAARTIAGLVEEEDIRSGSIFPPLNEIREVSLEIATAVAEEAYAMGIARRKKPHDIKSVISEYMYDPTY